MRISDWSSDVCSSDLRQHMGVGDRHPLSRVDSGGIAVIDMGIALEIDGDAPAIIEPHRQSVRRGLIYCADGAVLHAYFAFVLQEEATVVVGELAESGLGTLRDKLAECDLCTKPLDRTNSEYRKREDVRVAFRQ